MKIEKFEDIDAWRKARKLAKAVYVASNEGELSRDFGLRDQMRRGAVSVMSNIAEGFERGGDVEFRRFLLISKGPAGELRAQLYVALDAGLIDKAQFDTLYKLAIEVAGLIAGFIRYLNKGESQVGKSKVSPCGESKIVKSIIGDRKTKVTGQDDKTVKIERLEDSEADFRPSDLGPSTPREASKADLGPSTNGAPGPVPFLDLVTPHLQLEEELVSVFRSALKTAGFIGGSMVEGFETDFAAFCQTKHCVGAGSGTDALRFALIAAGIGPGDIVVTVPNTFIATTEAISQAGASPDFVDVFESTCNMDPEKLREYLEGRCVENSGGLFHRQRGLRIAGVVPVHLYGQPADMDPILELARKYNLIVVEDACQAHGAEYFSKRENSWKNAGSFGLAAAFSFYPGKNLGACGEAGAVTTDDAALASRVRMLRDHGQAKKYYHDVEGWNGRLDAIQAGILQVKLRRLPEWNQRRRECAALYSELLGDVPGVTLPSVGPGMRPVWHLYVIQTDRRDALQKYLADNGVSTGLHYPVPLHLQNSYLPMNLGAGSFPAAEAAASRILSLPMGPTLTKSQVERVAELIRRFF